MALTKISTAMISQSASAVDLNVDAGTFYVDTTNNRVGVGGKTDPDTPLHVIGTVTATLFAGSGASLTGIPNGALTNSSITINSSATSLGGSITLTTANIAENTNLYYTNARADARIAAADTNDLSEGSSNLYYTDARVNARVAGGSLGNITTTGYIRGPATFTIDPAAHGDNTGTVVIAGNLQVDGTQTTINSTTLTVDDKNITLASGSANASAASGAGFTVDIGSGTNPSITYDGTNDEWDFNKPLNVTGNIAVSGTVDGIDIAARDGVLTSTTTTAGAALPKAGGTMTGALTVKSPSTTGEQLILKIENAVSTGAIGKITFNQTNDEMHLSNEASGSLVFDVAAAEKMRIDSSGNVGIGISNPSSYYVNWNDLVVGSTSAASGMTIVSGTSHEGTIAFADGTSGDAQYRAYLQYDHNDNAFDIGVAAATRMRIDSSGKVGIGTTGPSAVLSLIDPDLTATGTGVGGLRVHRPNAASQYGYFDYGYGGGGINLGSLYTGGGAASFGTFTFRQHSSTTSQVPLFIDSTGDVLIGKTSDAFGTAGIALRGDVADFIRSGNTAINVNRLASDGSTMKFHQAGSLVGQVNTLSGRMAIGSGDTGLFFDSTRNCIAGFSMAANDGTNTIDLGRTGVKFKDAHFSGNVYVDGGLSVYQNGSTYRIASQSNETSALVNTYATLKTWKASQSGQVTTTFSAYIQLGSYYFRYRFYNVTKSAVVKMSDNSTDADYYYTANRTGNDGNVHHYQHYSLALGKVDRGDVIALQMQSSWYGGALVTGNGQIGYARNWKILASKTPAVERDTGVMERPQIYGASTHTQESNGTGAQMHTVPVALNSGTHSIFHILDGFDQGTVAHASFEFTGLYSYANANSSLGHMTTSIRRASGNSAWSVGAHTNHHETNGGSVSTPSFSWTSSGALQCIVAGSVQLTGVIRITTRTVPNYKWGIDI